MAGKDASSAVQLRHRDAHKTQTVSKPPPKAVTVSAAAMFKHKKVDTPQGQPSPRSLQKSTTKTVKKKQEVDVHPLALAFRGVIMCSTFKWKVLTVFQKRVKSTAVTSIQSL